MTFILIIVSMLVGWKLREFTAVRNIYKLMKLHKKNTEKDTEKDTVPKVIIAVRIEKHEDTFLVYNKKTGEFIIQGANREEIQFNLEKKFGSNTNISFNATEQNIKEIGLK